MGPTVDLEDEPGTQMHRALQKLVAGVMRTEAGSVEAAAMKLLVVLGLEGLRTRVAVQRRREPVKAGQTFEETVSQGECVELLVDEVTVWRGWWQRTAMHTSRWETRWFVDLDTLVSPPTT